MGGRQVLAARRLLSGALDGALPECELVATARAVVTELGSEERLLELITELAAGVGDPEANARLSYRHVLGFDKLLLIDGGPQRMLRAHVWHPGAAAVGKEDIHNHRSPLASYVVRGRLAMELYEVCDDRGLSVTRYRESLAEPAASWVLEPAGSARLRLTHLGHYAAGSSYALPARTLHRAWCDTNRPTVTLFLETGVERRPHTDVFSAAGLRRGAVEKAPLRTAEYLRALQTLADQLTTR